MSKKEKNMGKNHAQPREFEASSKYILMYSI